MCDLVRMDRVPGAGYILVAGEILTTGGLPPSGKMLPGFLALFLFF
jgi:hypothetical protein